MLNRDKANNELKQALQNLAPDWQDQAGDTFYYIDELLKVVQPARTSEVRDTTPLGKVADLRVRCRTMLNREAISHLDVKFCDQLFNIEFALAKLFPTNNLIRSHPETWDDPINGTTFTRETEDVIVFTRMFAITRESAIEFFIKNPSFSPDGRLRDMQNVELSSRELASLERQGISLNDTSTYQIKNLGSNVGRWLANFFCILGVATYVTVSFFSPTLLITIFMAGVLIKLLDQEAFDWFEFLKLTIISGGVTLAWFVFVVETLSHFQLLSAPTVIMLSGYFMSLALPLIVPAVLLAAAIIAYNNNQGVASTFRGLVEDIFLNRPAESLGRVGEQIGLQIWYVKRFIESLRDRFMEPTDVQGNATRLAAENSAAESHQSSSAMIRGLLGSVELLERSGVNYQVDNFLRNDSVQPSDSVVLEINDVDESVSQRVRARM
jgi:hypothetical protein